VGAALMTLDAIGDDPVQLQFDCGDGNLCAALALMDIIDLSGVPVRGMGFGQVAGPAVGAFAVCSRRTLSPHARIRLCEPRIEAEGSARQLQQLAEAHLDQWSAFCSRVAAACAQPEDRVRQDAAAGRFFSAQDAVGYGLADAVADPDARMVRLPGRRIGFGRG
jgi:ATP-dependent Clp protease, protease subunit